MKTIFVAVAAVALVGSGVFELTESFGRNNPEVAQKVQAKLDACPIVLPSWTSEALAFDEKQLAQTKAFAHLSRAYTNKTTGEILSLLVLAGEPDEIGAHDPERCYGGAGYRPVGTRQRKDLSAAQILLPVTYWSHRFDTDTFPANSLLVNWAWSTDGTWNAAEEARYEYVRQPVLYKLYLTQRLVPGAAPNSTRDSITEFLAEWAPSTHEKLSAK